MSTASVENGGPNIPMPLIPDIAVFQRKLATLPLVTYRAGETVLRAASTTGQLLILKEGKVAVVKLDVEIARVTEPGAVFGELSVLLDRPLLFAARPLPGAIRTLRRHRRGPRPDSDWLDGL
jgi:CRP-like cAMP-binding protein